MKPLARSCRTLAVVFLSLAAASAALAADVTKPSAVTGLLLSKSGSDVVMSWTAVTTDVNGAAETVSQYRIYRGATPDFVPDKSGGSNRIGTSATTGYTDSGALSSGIDGYYLVTAVDAAGNESESKPSTVTTIPTLSGFYTDTTIELNWTAGAPSSQVVKYLVYYGTSSRNYDSVKDVGNTLSTSLTES